MQTVSPGQTTIMTFPAVPGADPVGFQVINAVSGAVAIARTAIGVIERPAGTRNFVLNFVAPAEGDLYLVVVDWSGGVLSPETTRVADLKVTTDVQPGSSGLGAVADYAKMHLGGETWKGLSESVDYGEPFIFRAVELVKRRAMENPPGLAQENTLSILVLDYLGILAALQLIPAAIDYWGSQHISVSMGDDPTEIVTYANRANLMKDLRDDLMRRLPAAQSAALPHIDDPVLSTTSLPEIDEDDDIRSTADPRDFPSHADLLAGDFPADAYGIGPVRTGVRR